MSNILLNSFSYDVNPLLKLGSGESPFSPLANHEQLADKLQEFQQLVSSSQLLLLSCMGTLLGHCGHSALALQAVSPAYTVIMLSRAPARRAISLNICRSRRLTQLRVKRLRKGTSYLPCKIACPAMLLFRSLPWMHRFTAKR